MSRIPYLQSFVSTTLYGGFVFGKQKGVNVGFGSSDFSALDNIIRKQVEEHRKSASRADWKSGNGDILDRALMDSEYGTKASTSEIVDQMKTFFFAGNDTTSAVLSWIYIYLSKNPSILARLRKELDSVFGANTEPDDVADQILTNPKLLNQLEYTLAVIRETLRLEPPAQPIRTPAQPYSVTTRLGTTCVIEPGVMVMINVYQMARSKMVWGEDAEVFNPERFLNKSVPSAFMSFSRRPRDCIGTNLAYLEV